MDKTQRPGDLTFSKPLSAHSWWIDRLVKRMNEAAGQIAWIKTFQPTSFNEITIESQVMVFVRRLSSENYTFISNGFCEFCWRLLNSETESLFETETCGKLTTFEFDFWQGW